MNTDTTAGTVLILGIVGSLRRDSFNRKLLQAAKDLVPSDAQLNIWDGLKAIPPFDEDDERKPPTTVLAMHSAFERADALVIATPQYNASLPGQLKNALDWASRPYESNVLRGKPVAVIGASASPSGARRSHAEVRTVLDAIGADVLDVGLSIGRVVGSFDDQGHLLDDEHRARLRQVVQDLIRLASERRAPMSVKGIA